MEAGIGADVVNLTLENHPSILVCVVQGDLLACDVLAQCCAAKAVEVGVGARELEPVDLAVALFKCDLQMDGYK